MIKPSIKDPTVIFQTADIDEPIVVKEQKGQYQKIRRSLGWILTLLFILLPFLQYQGQQAILFDVGQQTLSVFAYQFYPQDLLIFVFLFLFAAFGLFYVSTKYGRVWCGYACPQTIWTMLFLWLEFRIEGNRQARLKMAKMPMTAKTLSLKALKHVSWCGVSLITALVFMSYFVPATSLYREFFNLELTPLVTNWTLFFATCTYLNAGWVREKMCEHMCPYARFQSVMFNENTKVITYDSERGEHRGPRKRQGGKPEALGDCVDCKQCVHVCPVGIDIRNGLQYQCISCGLCIDACDQIMDTFSYPKGLIEYQGMNKNQSKQNFPFAYLLLLVTITLLTLAWFWQRTETEVSIIRDRNVLFRELDNGVIENVYQVKILNKTRESARYQLSMAADSEFKLQATKVLEVAPGEQVSTMVSVHSPREYQQGFQDIKFELNRLTSPESLTFKSSFLSR